MDAPEYFPLIRGMSVLTGDVLLLTRWNSATGKDRHSLDFSGRDAVLPFDWAAYSRVVAIHGQDVYLSGYDEESGQGMLIRCLLTDVASVAARYPIKFKPPPSAYTMLK